MAAGEPIPPDEGLAGRLHAVGSWEDGAPAPGRPG